MANIPDEANMGETLNIKKCLNKNFNVGVE